MADKPKTIGGRVSQLEGQFKAIMTDLGEIKTKLRLANGGGKKPRRVEIMLGIMGILVAAQTLGVIEGLRAAIQGWLTGG